ncbi:hypothetical protein BDN67DRAFT_972203 [Paxillus ammoniavirescens]|nr:hypothetical protein BDN67DRAFT_972203 [Paxillus ammoniavirescens]
MKSFLTLLVTITSLSAYALAGTDIQIQCGVCPAKLNDPGGSLLVSQCAANGVTTCMYKRSAKHKNAKFFCNYNVCTSGARQTPSDALCPTKVGLGNMCKVCGH